MIGHVLLALTPAGEDQVLTTPMLPLHGGHTNGGPCLLIVATSVKGGFRQWADSYRGGDRLSFSAIGDRFDALCHRFGVPRITAAIRSRILSNRARRVLASAQVPAAV